MKQTIYYSDARSSEFSIERYEYFDKVGHCTIGEMIFVRGHSGINQIFLTSPEQIDEFCELLQNKKSEIWPESITIYEFNKPPYTKSISKNIEE